MASAEPNQFCLGAPLVPSGELTYGWSQPSLKNVDRLSGCHSSADLRRRSTRESRRAVPARSEPAVPRGRRQACRGACVRVRQSRRFRVNRRNDVRLRARRSHACAIRGIGGRYVGLGRGRRQPYAGQSRERSHANASNTPFTGKRPMLGIASCERARTPPRGTSILKLVSAHTRVQLENCGIFWHAPADRPHCFPCSSLQRSKRVDQGG